MPDFLPRREDELLQWCRNFRDQTSGEPAAFALSVEDVNAYAIAFEAFEQAYRRAVDPTTRGGATVLAKNVALRKLKALTRDLAGRVRTGPGVLPLTKARVGIYEASQRRTPLPPPSRAPLLRSRWVEGRRVRVWLRDAESPDVTRKPYGVDGAVVLVWYRDAAVDRADIAGDAAGDGAVSGDVPPSPASRLAPPEGWCHLATMTRTSGVLTLPARPTPGTRVWLTAAWHGTRGQMGPYASPTAARVGFDDAPAVGEGLRGAA